MRRQAIRELLTTSAKGHQAISRPEYSGDYTALRSLQKRGSLVYRPPEQSVAQKNGAIGPTIWSLNRKTEPRDRLPQSVSAEKQYPPNQILYPTALL